MRFLKHLLFSFVFVIKVLCDDVIGCTSFAMSDDSCKSISSYWKGTGRFINPFYNCFKIWNQDTCSGLHVQVPIFNRNQDIKKMSMGKNKTWENSPVSGVSGCYYPDYTTTTPSTTTISPPSTTTTTTPAPEHWEEDVLYFILPLSVLLIVTILLMFFALCLRRKRETPYSRIDEDPQSQLIIEENAQLFPSASIFNQNETIESQDTPTTTVGPNSLPQRRPSLRSFSLKQIFHENVIADSSYRQVFKAVDSKVNTSICPDNGFIDASNVVAIKRLNMHFMAKEYKWGRKEFLTEPRILNKIKHENVVGFHDCWIQGVKRIYPWKEANDEVFEELKKDWDASSGQSLRTNYYIFIEMEFCNGSMEDWLDKYEDIESRMEDQETIPQMFQQIVDGLSVVHSKGVIHRDIYPANILYKEKNTGQKIWKIADFGFSKENVTRSCDHNMIRLGAESFRSPEMLAKKGYNHKTDVFSLGLVFFMVLLPGLTDIKVKRDKIFEKIKNCSEKEKDLETLEYFYDKVPDTLKESAAIVKHMLYSNPSFRPSSEMLNFVRK